MRKVLFISLGCDKNLVDSERMLGSLAACGYEITDDETEADVIVINTCSFIHDARDESVSNILDMAGLKKDGRLKALIITGCLAEYYGQDILDELAEVDAVIGTNSFDALPSVIDRVYAGERLVVKKDLRGFPKTSGRRVITTGGHYEYLKIAEGCDKRCSYCAIPKFRGSYRSVPMEQLLDEARALAEEGVSELCLVAQETTLYGVDLYGEKRLHVLLEELCKIDGLHWIRVMYCYPEEIDDKLIKTIKNQSKICNYLDIPIQHCSDGILRRMRRKTTKADLKRIINHLRSEIPGIALRTTLICGFPGESEKEHEELLDFIREMKFERLGAFAYSREDDTPAAAMPNQIDEDEKKRRVEAVMLLQQEISEKRNEALKGSVMEVFVEGRIPDDGVYIGRSCADAHDIDGYVFFESDAALDSGEYVNVRITDSSQYDLYGVMT